MTAPRIPDLMGGYTKFEGGEEWYENGKRHRLDGPAFISEAGMEWFCHGQNHCEDGPAIMWTEGTVAYYLHGVLYRDINSYLEALDTSQEKKVFIKLKWGDTPIHSNYSM